MSRRKSLDPAVIESIAQNIFNVMPLLRKRLLHMDVIQSEHGIPLSHVQVLSMLNRNRVHVRIGDFPPPGHCQAEHYAPCRSSD